MQEIYLSTLEITDNLKNETTDWADRVIERFKMAMRLEKTYLRWNEPLMYTIGGDAWIDESWWIETAQYLFAKQDREYDGLGGVSALEILVFHYPEQFKKIALAKIDKWNRDPGDYENWYELVALTNQEHPLLIALLEEPKSIESIRELAFLANIGHLKAIDTCRSWIVDCVAESDLSYMWEFFDRLDKKVIVEILSEKLMQQAQEEARKIALRESDFENYDHFSILFPAIKLGWEDVVDYLSENSEYLNFLQKEIIYLGNYKSFSDRTILEWSLSSKNNLTQQLVLLSKQVLDASPFLDELNNELKTSQLAKEYGPIEISEMDKLNKSIQLAIAWKRSVKKL